MVEKPRISRRFKTLAMGKEPSQNQCLLWTSQVFTDCPAFLASLHHVDESLLPPLAADCVSLSDFSFCAFCAQNDFVSDPRPSVSSSTAVSSWISWGSSSNWSIRLMIRVRNFAPLISKKVHSPSCKSARRRGRADDEITDVITMLRRRFLVLLEGALADTRLRRLSL
jgi:hypothetical protein